MKFSYLLFIYELWYDFIRSAKKLIQIINEKNQINWSKTTIQESQPLKKLEKSLKCLPKLQDEV